MRPQAGEACPTGSRLLACWASWPQEGAAWGPGGLQREKGEETSQPQLYTHLLPQRLQPASSSLASLQGNTPAVFPPAFQETMQRGGVLLKHPRKLDHDQNSPAGLVSSAGPRAGHQYPLLPLTLSRQWEAGWGQGQARPLPGSSCSGQASQLEGAHPQEGRRPHPFTRQLSRVTSEDRW